MRATWLGTVPSLALLAWTSLLAPGRAAAADTDGYLYGRVTMTSGDRYEGLLRWGTEEAFWDDVFHSSKVDLPAMEHAPKRDRRQGKSRVEVFGFRMEWNEDGTSARQFACRFGDIERIEVTGDEDALVHMKGGARVEVSGYSNDVGNAITVWDTSLGKIDLRWSRIETIEFLPTPAEVRPAGYRLRGRVATDGGEFVGFVQWDSEECLSSDLLNGDAEDGEMAIEMGRIRSIENRGSRSLVELKDGRTLLLDGSNDVDDTIRGILVEDERYGRVEVRWVAFDKVVFEDQGPSGRGYDTYRGGSDLQAAVVDVDGETRTGRIYFDLDESQGWEFLNGEFTDVEYNIPFAAIATVEPKGGRSARVTLRNGESLRLSDSQDVSEHNDGILVFTRGSNGDPEYIAWGDVEKIELRW